MSVVGMMTVDDLIGFCMDEMNRQLRLDLLERNLKQERQEASNTTTTTTSNQSHYARLNAATTHNNGTDPLEEGIRMRLEYLSPYLKSGRWHEGMALGVRGPSNALQTRQQLQEMIECIVDHSTNIKTLQYSTPTKMALGAVYVATELHLLSDTSPGYHDTWDFLSSRMDDWRRLTAMTGDSPDGSVGSSSSGLPAPSDALFVVSSVASSLVGGALSLVMNNNSISAATNNKNGMFGLPHEVLAALFQANQSGWGSSSSGSSSSNGNGTTTSTSTMDGTQPNHYDAPKKIS